MKKLILVTIFLLLSGARVLASDADILNGLSYLSSKQNVDGSIAGFGGESYWAVVAYSANGVDVTTVSNNEISLMDYVLNNLPNESTSTTDLERVILALRATEIDPSNVNGINLIEILESRYQDNQIGDTTLLNDDIFGILALNEITEQNEVIFTNSFNYILAHQKENGGFSWSTEDCVWCSPDSNDTSAAIQALQLAKDNHISEIEVSEAITTALNYLLTLQKPDGGFGYDEFSDSDGSSTAWALMALNVLDMSESESASLARNWLIESQSENGGFPWMIGFEPDTYTTSHALIALSGNGWIVDQPAESVILSVTNTPTPTPTLTLTLTPSPTSTITSTPTPKPSPTLTLTVTKNKNRKLVLGESDTIKTPTPTTTEEVKGVERDTRVETESIENESKHQQIYRIVSVITVLLIFVLGGIYIYPKFTSKPS